VRKFMNHKKIFGLSCAFKYSVNTCSSQWNG